MWQEARALLESAYGIIRANLRSLLLFNIAVALVLIAVHYFALFQVIELTYVRRYQKMLMAFFTQPVIAYLFLISLKYHSHVILKKNTLTPAILKLTLRYFDILAFTLFAYGGYYILLEVMLDILEFEIEMQIRLILGAMLYCWAIARLGFAPLLIIEQNISLRRSLQHSYLMTSRRTRQALRLWLLLLAVLAVGAISVLGLPVAMAAAFLIYTIACNDFRSSMNTAAPAPPATKQ